MAFEIKKGSPGGGIDNHTTVSFGQLLCDYWFSFNGLTNNEKAAIKAWLLLESAMMTVVTLGQVQDARGR